MGKEAVNEDLSDLVRKGGGKISIVNGDKIGAKYPTKPFVVAREEIKEKIKAVNKGKKGTE